MFCGIFFCRWQCPNWLCLYPSPCQSEKRMLTASFQRRIWLNILKLFSLKPPLVCERNQNPYFQLWRLLFKILKRIILWYCQYCHVYPLFCFFTAQCTSTHDMLTTFNNRRFRNEVPLSCYQVLAQDCTSELKFIVLMKKDRITEQKHLSVKLSDMWVIYQ